MQTGNDSLHGVLEEKRVHVGILRFSLQRLLQMQNGKVRTTLKSATLCSAAKFRPIPPFKGCFATQIEEIETQMLTSFLNELHRGLMEYDQDLLDGFDDRQAKLHS